MDMQVYSLHLSSSSSVVGLSQCNLLLIAAGALLPSYPGMYEKALSAPGPAHCLP